MTEYIIILGLLESLKLNTSNKRRTNFHLFDSLSTSFRSIIYSIFDFVSEIHQFIKREVGSKIDSIWLIYIFLILIDSMNYVLLFVKYLLYQLLFLMLQMIKLLLLYHLEQVSTLRVILFSSLIFLSSLFTLASNRATKIKN